MVLAFRSERFPYTSPPPPCPKDRPFLGVAEEWLRPRHVCWPGLNHSRVASPPTHRAMTGGGQSALRPISQSQPLDQASRLNLEFKPLAALPTLFSSPFPAPKPRAPDE